MTTSTSSAELINLSGYSGYPMGLKYKTISNEMIEIDYVDTVTPTVGQTVKHWVSPRTMADNMFIVDKIIDCEHRPGKDNYLIKIHAKRTL